jgi:hypothetical protein
MLLLSYFTVNIWTDILQVLCHTLYAVDDTFEYDSSLPNAFFCARFAEWVDIYINNLQLSRIYVCKTARMASFLRRFHSLKSWNFCSPKRCRNSKYVLRWVAYKRPSMDIVWCAWIYQNRSINNITSQRVGVCVTLITRSHPHPSCMIVKYSKKTEKEV